MLRLILTAIVFSISVAGFGISANARTNDLSPLPPSARSATADTFKVAQRRCRSVDSMLRRLARRGYYDFHKVNAKSRSVRLRAYKRGIRYKIKLERCTGNIIWTQVK